MKCLLSAFVLAMPLALSSSVMAADSPPYNRLMADQIASALKANRGKAQYAIVVDVFDFVVDVFDFNDDDKSSAYDVLWPAVE